MIGETVITDKKGLITGCEEGKVIRIGWLFFRKVVGSAHNSRLLVDPKKKEIPPSHPSILDFFSVY